MDPRMSSSIQVGLTALFMLTTSVLAFGVDMLVIVSGKKPGHVRRPVRRGCLDGRLDLIDSENSRSLEETVSPFDHFQGFRVIDIVLSPFDQTGGFATLSVSSTV